MNKEPENKENWSDLDKAWWEFLLHNEKSITDRTNFFLLAESFLVAAAVVLITSDKVHSYYFPYFILNLVIIAGLFVSCAWLYLGREMFKRQGAVRDTKVHYFFEDFTSTLNLYKSPISSNRVITQGIPGIFAMGWAVAFLVVHCSL